MVYLIYAVGLVARLSIDLTFIGPAMFGFTSAITLTGTALYGTMATDLVLVFGAGLLIGRNVRAVKRCRRIQRGEESVPSTPPPRLGGRPADRTSAAQP